MSNIAFYTDVTLTSNVPTAQLTFICIEKSPSKAVFLDVSTTDTRLQQKITVTVRPGDEISKVRQKFVISHIYPILVNEGEVDEYVDVRITRVETETPPSYMYSDRLQAAITGVNRAAYLINGFNTQNADIASMLKYGTVVCD